MHTAVAAPAELCTLLRYRAFFTPKCFCVLAFHDDWHIVHTCTSGPVKIHMLPIAVTLYLYLMWQNQCRRKYTVASYQGQAVLAWVLSHSMCIVISEQYSSPGLVLLCL